MTHQQVAALFDAWWQESFPLAPANKQARENFVAFGLMVLANISTTPTPNAEALLPDQLSQ